MDDADKYMMRQAIASLLDHPSVYMGGPSHGSVRKAIAIVGLILDEYEVTPRSQKHADVVREWRKSPWDSLERV